MSDPREKYYKRNYIALITEGFFFTFALSIFSHSTVLPVYVSNLTDNRFWISFLALTFFGLSNGSSILSCVIGVNARSAKWIAVIITGTQRIGLFFIFLSTYLISGSEIVSLSIFFFSYAVYGFTAGMAIPVFSNMISNVMYRNVSSFYGSYTLMGGVAGVISSQLVTFLIATYNFPLNYRYLFLAGLIMAFMSTLVVMFGVKEIPIEKKKKLTYRELPGLVINIFKNNHQFRSFVIVRIFTSAAEMTIPFYIIRVSMIEGVAESFVGVMSAVLLVSNLVFAKLLGNIGDKKGPFFLIQLGCYAGLVASTLAILINSQFLAFPLFILVSITIQAVQVSNNVAVIVYAQTNLVPVYAASSGLIIAPIYSIFSLSGGIFSNRFDFVYLFYFSFLIYGLGLYFSRKYKNRFFVKV